MSSSSLQIKRIYDPPENTDGFRVLVDRLWPRGLKKEAAQLDAWMKEVSPSPALRKWFSHDPAKWKEFGRAYVTELERSEAVEELTDYLEKHKTVTLLYAAKDREHTHALVLKRFIEKLLK